MNERFEWHESPETFGIIPAKTRRTIFPRYAPGKFSHGNVRIMPIAVGNIFPASADSIYPSVVLHRFVPRVYAICIRVI